MPTTIRQLTSDEIPAQLIEIAEPPEKLYLEGKLPPPEFQLLTVVGSRKFSSYGRDVCEKIITGLAGYPIAIISGLALGIDTIAHKTALKARLPTIGIPGSGLDRSVLHPHSNRRLADEIVASGGSLLSEFPPTMPAGLHTFPRRNRIMAGLARATLVIEAGEKSGTLITARLATEYNRDCFAVPGSIFSPSSQGANWLIKQGATPITSSEDILSAFNLETEGLFSSKNKLSAQLLELSPAEQKILNIIMIEPLPRDLLIEELSLPIHEANTLLSTMEIKGLIKEEMGEIRIR